MTSRRKGILAGVYRRLVRVDDSPGRIAGGFAVGVFMGMFPTFGLGGIAAAATAAFLRFNVAAALLGAAIGVPPLIFVVWIASAWLGSAMLGLDFSEIHALAREGRVFAAGLRGGIAYGLGNLVLTVILSGLAFLAARGLIRRKRAQRRS